jgi:hypothetical protein
MKQMQQQFCNKAVSGAEDVCRKVQKVRQYNVGMD